MELDELDLTSTESKATYAKNKDYALKEHGLKVSNLYISQIKRKCGIEVGRTIICLSRKITDSYNVRWRRKSD